MNLAHQCIWIVNNIIECVFIYNYNKKLFSKLYVMSSLMSVSVLVSGLLTHVRLFLYLRYLHHCSLLSAC